MKDTILNQKFLMNQSSFCIELLELNIFDTPGHGNLFRF